MSNGVRGPASTTVSNLPALGREERSRGPATQPEQAAVGQGFNASNSFGASSATAPAPAPAPAQAPAPAETREDNHGQTRAELAHQFNTLRKALQFANHKGNPNAKFASEAQVREAVSSISKLLGVNLGDISKKSPVEAMTMLAGKLGIQSPSTTSAQSPSTASAGTSTTDPMALFQQILKKALGEVKPEGSARS